jgi:hypothetical protein
MPSCVGGTVVGGGSVGAGGGGSVGGGVVVGHGGGGTVVVVVVVVPGSVVVVVLVVVVVVPGSVVVVVVVVTGTQGRVSGTVVGATVEATVGATLLVDELVALDGGVVGSVVSTGSLVLGGASVVGVDPVTTEPPNRQNALASRTSMAALAAAEGRELIGIGAGRRASEGTFACPLHKVIGRPRSRIDLLGSAGHR